MKHWRSKRGALTLSLLILVALFGIRPGANRLRAQIVDSISRALGRSVEVASVNLRLLPRPGFDLENFVVHDDPRFSAEPLLRAGEVTAALRIMPLFRGRLEIARLSFTQPSLNLVRNPEGRWNVEDLLVRAAQTKAAPTGKATMERRPGFPYMAADHSRINLKFGAEKKPYSLADADFALWQDSENTWGVRLKGQALRTDFNLTDTGTIRVDGLWQRSATLRETPLQFNLRWDGGQLGQLTQLAYGGDKGWRGSMTIFVALSGTPSNLQIAARTTIDDFRRYDVLGGGAMRLAAQCSGRYSIVSSVLSDISCDAPIGDGSINMAGRLANPTGARSYDLALSVHNLPMQALVAFARHAKQSIPYDLLASGILDADIRVRQSSNARADWEGGGETSGFRLSSELTNTDLALGKVPFVFSSSALMAKAGTGGRILNAIPAESHVDIGPVNLALGKSLPTVVHGVLWHTGYRVLVQGDASVSRLLRLARSVGLAAPQPAAEGSAKVDLQIAGGWPGFAAPTLTGKAQLHSVRAEIHGLNAPLEINSAALVITPDRIQVQNVNASLAGSLWRGSLLLPRPYLQAARLPITFDLHADEISIDQLNRVLNPHARKQPWYRFLYPANTLGTPYLLTVDAKGKLSTDRLLIYQLRAGHVSALAELKNGKLSLAEVRADLLDGKHLGEWKADFTAKPPLYSGSGSLERMGLDQLAKAMKDGWITGVADATYRVTASGFDVPELVNSATSTLQVDVRDAVMPHIALQESAGPLRVRRLQTRLVFQDGQFDFQDGRLATATDSYELSGTASLDRMLNLTLNRDGSPVFNITGTLTEPHVSPITSAETQAALKP